MEQVVPTIKELRAEAKESGVNSFQKSREDLAEMLGYTKKSSRPWRPATMLAVQDKDPALTYRWCDNDPGNLERKRLEGWEFDNSLSGSEATHESTHVSDGKSLDTAKTYRELVLMTMDEDTARARKAYYSMRTRKQTVGLVEDLRSDFANKAQSSGAAVAPVHGSIVIN
ncbi:MAG: hypothetical protein J3T61_00230 [Candidatus Brocadiales bacterium]|nr:hypothetical protein [Candidatus Bathyanammoxibius sp.]